MKKIIATSAIALALFVPVGSAAMAAELPAPVVGSTQAAIDQISIQGPSIVGHHKMLDITGKVGPNHAGERIEILRDGSRIDDNIRAPKVDSAGNLLVSAESGSQGTHRYEIRLFNRNDQMTAISNTITVFTQ